jgi:hypothetical protein
VADQRIIIDMPHVVTIPLGAGLLRSATIDAVHVRHKVPKIDVGGTLMTLPEVENVALTMLYMVRTHPDGPGLLSETATTSHRTPPRKQSRTR